MSSCLGGKSIILKEVLYKFKRSRAAHDSKVLVRFLTPSGGASQFEANFSSCQVSLDHNAKNSVLTRGESLNTLRCRPKTKTGKVLDAWLSGTAVLDESVMPTEIATTERDLAGLA